MAGVGSWAAIADRTLVRLYALCGAIAASAIVLIAVLVATSIAARFLGVFVGGLTEGAGYAMAAAGTFGLAYAFGAGSHIRVDLVLNALPSKARKISEFVALAVTTLTAVWLAWFMARMVVISWKFGDLSDGSDGLPLWLPQFPAALGFGIFAIALIHHLIRFWVTGEISWRMSERNLLNDDEGQ